MTISSRLAKGQRQPPAIFYTTCSCAGRPSLCGYAHTHAHTKSFSSQLQIAQACTWCYMAAEGACLRTFVPLFLCMCVCILRCCMRVLMRLVAPTSALTQNDTWQDHNKSEQLYVRNSCVKRPNVRLWFHFRHPSALIHKTWNTSWGECCKFSSSGTGRNKMSSGDRRLIKKTLSFEWACPTCFIYISFWREI